MSLKSLVNVSIIKSDLRRYWYLGALFALMIFLTSVMFIISMRYNVQELETMSFVQTRFSSTMSISLIPICMFCVLIPAVIFSYIHHKSAMPLMHSLPSRRDGLFVSHLISSFALILVALIINVVILLSMRENVAFLYRVSDVFAWFGISIVYCFVIMCISILASIITGNVMASIVAPYAIALIVPFCEMVYCYICQVYLYGFDVNNPFIISEKLYMDYEAMIKDYGIILYLAIGIVCLVASLICYKKRSLENYGMVVSFKKLNPVFLYGLAICFGLCGFMYVGEVTDFESLWFALPFGAVGVIVAKMIIQKTFKPKGFIKPIAIYTVFICIIYALSALDITGYENRIPDIDDIESVNVVNGNLHLGGQYIEGTEVYADNDKMHNPTVTGNDIEKVIKLHKAIVENKSALDTKEIVSGVNYTYQPIEYTLKNGKTLKRGYRLIKGEETIYEPYASVMEIESVKADRFPILSDAPKHFEDVQIYIYDHNIKHVESDDLTKLLDAMRQDISAAKYEDYDAKNSAITVRISYRIPTKTKLGEEITDKKLWWDRQETYNIHKSYKNTIKLLGEWGISGGMDILDDIKSVEVSSVPDDAEEMQKYMALSEKDKDAPLATYTNAQDIKEVMAYIDEHVENNIRTHKGKHYEFHIVFKNDSASGVHIVSDKKPPQV